MITALVLLSAIRLPGVTLGLHYIVLGLYVIHGFILNAQLGLSFTPVLLICYVASQAFQRAAGPDNTLPVALSLHLVSWIVQFYGHYRYEKRAPALTQSVIQALSSGPIVLWMDLIFSSGFMLDLKARLNRAHIVAKARKAVNQAGQ